MTSQSHKSLCLHETIIISHYFIVNKPAFFACLQLVALWSMYKEQRGGEAPRKFSFSVFICIQKEELEVGVSGHHNSGQEASRDRKHITLWSSRLVKVEGRPDTLFSSSPLTASRTWSPCRCLPPQSPTKNTEHVKHMSLFLGPQIHPVNVHKMVVECRPAAQEPMKYSRFPLIPHPLLGELKYSALV